MAGIGSMLKQKIGDMRHRIDIETPTETQDDAGQPIVEWVARQVFVPANVVELNGTESMRGRQLQAGVQAIFTIWKDDAIDNTHRIVFAGKNYGILYVNTVDGARPFLELLAKRIEVASS